jgi:LacI family transcriptional regulator
MSSHAPATLRLIADQCGVSMTTVSKILRGKYKGNTPKGKKSVESVTTLAKKMGYIANGSARRLRDGKHRAIVVLTPVDPSGHPAFFTFEYITGIASILSRARYALSLSTYPSSQSDLAVGRLSDRNFDAAIVLEETSPELDRFLSAAAIPSVHVNIAPARGRRTLCRDEYAAGRGLVELLAGLGYRKLHVVGSLIGPGAHFSLLQRQAGITDAVAATGMHVTSSDIEVWDGGFETVIMAARIPADAVVLTLSSATVLRLMRCLPSSQPIACCDDAHLFINLAPGLTRATFDRASLGRTAAEYLLRRIDNPSATLDATPVRSGIQVGNSTPAIMGRAQPAGLQPRSEPT